MPKIDQAKVQAKETVASQPEPPVQSAPIYFDDPQSAVPAHDLKTEVQRAAPVQPHSNPVTLNDIPLHGMTRGRLLEQIRRINAERALAAEKPHVPPPRNARQQAQLEAEIAAGQAATERARGQRVAELTPQPQHAKPPHTMSQTPPTPESSTPVHRPGDHVPNFNQGHVMERNGQRVVNPPVRDV